VGAVTQTHASLLCEVWVVNYGWCCLGLWSMQIDGSIKNSTRKR